METNSPLQEIPPIKKRGFAALDPETLRAIAKKGGLASQKSGKAHRFNSVEATEAGWKGGEVVSRDREHMAEIGRKGGKAAQKSGKAHKFTPEEAKEAGVKSGKKRRLAAIAALEASLDLAAQQFSQKDKPPTDQKALMTTGIYTNATQLEILDPSNQLSERSVDSSISPCH